MTPEEFQTKQEEMLSRVPVEFHSNLKVKAWEEGHAYGYNEVLLHLDDFIYMIEKPLAEYVKRITSPG